MGHYTGKKVANPIPILCIGCGSMGSSHVRAYHKMAGFKIVGLVDRNPEVTARLSAELGGLPQFCAAINRHVLAEPADWNNPAKYYRAAPANFYAKFWHDHSINGRAYGFCYDDVNAQDTLIEARNPVNLIVTIYWD